MKDRGAIRDELAEVLAVEPSPNRVFRGQTAEYPELLPSLYRPGAKVDLEPYRALMETIYDEAYGISERADDLRNLLAREQDERMDAADRFAEQAAIEGRRLKGDELARHEAETARIWEVMQTPAFPGLDPEAFDPYVNHPYIFPRKFLPLLQHYGVPTALLDVSYDPLVALFFARHELRPTDHGRVTFGRTERQGYLYVMKATDKALVDLRDDAFLPMAGKRGARQKGGLLKGATSRRPDLRRHVEATVVVPAELDVDTFADPRLSQSYLFPSVAEDPLYRILVRTKHQHVPELEVLLREVPEYEVEVRPTEPTQR
jgi:hypothetical protein